MIAGILFGFLPLAIWLYLLLFHNGFWLLRERDTKPMAAPALIPIGLALLLRGRGWFTNGVIFSAVMIGVLAIIVVAVGPAQVYDQMIRFRAASRQVEGWSLKENWAAITGEIADEHDEDGDAGFSPVAEDDEGWIADGRTPLEELESAMGEGVDLAPPGLDEESRGLCPGGLAGDP